MKEVTVRIEEHLVKEVKCSVETENVDEAIKKAEEEVFQKYRKGEIILSNDDYNGVTLFQSECDGVCTEWYQ